VNAMFSIHFYFFFFVLRFAETELWEPGKLLHLKLNSGILQQISLLQKAKKNDRQLGFGHAEFQASLSKAQSKPEDT